MPNQPRNTYATGAVALGQQDPVIAKLVEICGLPAIRPPLDTPFAALIRSVLYQQLAGAAAAAIHGRVIAAVDGDVSPAAIAALGVDRLRAAGVSAAKEASIRDLATKVLEGSVLLEPRRMWRETDDEIIANLSSVRGIGRWTAQMFLMFQLRRLDIWPAGDLGVRRGFGLAWTIPTPTERQLEPLGDAFRPFRSVAAWYCWRACEVYAAAPASEMTR
jgi:DNA-3-methyladenine glycosylase II